MHRSTTGKLEAHFLILPFYSVLYKCFHFRKGSSFSDVHRENLLATSHWQHSIPVNKLHSDNNSNS